MSGRLLNRRALIVGGGSGIGAATARLFVEEGAAVAVADFYGDRAKAVAEGLRDHSKDVFDVQLDTSIETEVEAAVERTAEVLGGLDTVVNAAGLWKAVPVWEMEESEWDRMLNVCLKGPFLVCKHTIPHLRANGGGAIVNIGSIGSFVSSIAAPHYGAAKGGIRILTKSIAISVAKENIRVNSVCPGPTETGLYDDNIGLETIRNRITPVIPMGRMGRPEEIAAAVVFAASDEASFMTGQDIVIDGGFLSV